jgi:pyruvate dehydrogenase E1 component alpha subunit
MVPVVAGQPIETGGWPTVEPDDKKLLEMHRSMLTIRRFEEEAGRIIEAGGMPGFVHLYIGQEAVAVGVMAHLRPEDQITSTHRGHGHLIAKGGDLKLMFAELYGKATGYCRGKGGSMHICDPDLGILGSNGIVAAGPPIAAGAAFSAMYRGTDNVAVAFFGDGASNEGAFHEALNLAGLMNLPAIFVCENNLYGEFTGQARHQKIKDIAVRAEGYGFPGVIVDGQDVTQMYRVAGEAIERARQGGGPTLIEAKTYRFFDHVGLAGMGPVYRDPDEVASWRLRDPITALESLLLERDLVTTGELAAINDEIVGSVADAVRFAEESPLPDPATLLDDVYSMPFDMPLTTRGVR